MLHPFQLCSCRGARHAYKSLVRLHVLPSLLLNFPLHTQSWITVRHFTCIHYKEKRIYDFLKIWSNWIGASWFLWIEFLKRRFLRGSGWFTDRVPSILYLARGWREIRPPKENTWREPLFLPPPQMSDKILGDMRAHYAPRGSGREVKRSKSHFPSLVFPFFFFLCCRPFSILSEPGFDSVYTNARFFLIPKESRRW